MRTSKFAGIDSKQNLFLTGLIHKLISSFSQKLQIGCDENSWFKYVNCMLNNFRKIPMSTNWDVDIELLFTQQGYLETLNRFLFVGVETMEMTNKENLTIK
jgi:hypothetical protein